MTNLLDDIRFYYKQNWQRFVMEYTVWIFATLFHAANNYKSLNYKISHEKKVLNLQNSND